MHGLVCRQWIFKMNISTFYKNKVVIITGSSMGIGKELAKQILACGGKVVITGRNAMRLQAVAAEFSEYEQALLMHVGDVSDYENDKTLIEKTIRHFGKLDVLINNAGLSGFGEVETLNASAIRQVIDTNIYGSLFPVMAALPELKKTGGSILFISSLAGFYGLPSYSAYSLSKMSLRALAQSLEIEMKSKNIFVGISYIGFTENEDEKKTLSPSGEWVNVPKRPKLLTNSRQKTATQLLKQIKNKKKIKTHSFFGKSISIISRLFPFLLGSIYKWNYQKRLPPQS